jgi:hypothetical protein
LAALLLEEKFQGEAQAIQEFRRRAEIRRKVNQIRQMTLAIINAQAAGDPQVEALKHELERLQRQARELRELASSRSQEHIR